MTHDDEGAGAKPSVTAHQVRLERPLTNICAEASHETPHMAEWTACIDSACRHRHGRGGIAERQSRHVRGRQGGGA